MNGGADLSTPVTLHVARSIHFFTVKRAQSTGVREKKRARKREEQDGTKTEEKKEEVFVALCVDLPLSVESSRVPLFLRPLQLFRRLSHTLRTPARAGRGNRLSDRPLKYGSRILAVHLQPLE
jgi:hypothetical protein